MTTVEKSEVSPNLAWMWCGKCLYIRTIYAVLLYVGMLVLLQFTHFCCEICFVGIYAPLCGEKLKQKLHLWRKITNMRCAKHKSNHLPFCVALYHKITVETFDFWFLILFSRGPSNWMQPNVRNANMIFHIISWHLTQKKGFCFFLKGGYRIYLFFYRPF